MTSVLLLSFVKKEKVPFLVAACLFCALYPASFHDNLFFYLSCFFFLGLPHGAFDPLISYQKIWHTPLELMLFLTFYLFISLLCLVCWFFLPALSLTFFYFVSAYHFAGDWPSRAILTRFLLGSAFLALPLFFHPQEVQAVFFLLVGESAKSLVETFTLFVYFLPFCLAFFYREKSVLFEFSVLIPLSYFFEPLAFFMLYFCFLHSIKHYYDHWQDLRMSLPFIALFLVIILLTLSVFLGTLFFFSSQKEIIFSALTVRVIFIGLFCLTIPHMLVVEVFLKKLKKTSSR